MVNLKQDIANSNLIYAAMRDLPNPILQEDETENDSDKTFTVPAGKIWDICWVFVELTSTATAGNRQFTIRFLGPDDDVIAEFFAAVTQAASLSYKYMCVEGNYHEAALVVYSIEVPMPLHSILPAGFKMQVLDSNAIAAAADDMIVHMMVNEWDVAQPGEV